MNTALRVVAIVGSSTDPDQLLRAALGGASLAEELENASGRHVALKLVSWMPSEDIPQGIVVGSSAHRPALDRVISGTGAASLHGMLQKFPLGRLLNSLGPLDQSRIFWRAVREHEGAMTALQSADVLLAVDLPAVRAAWKTRRSNPSIEAYYGLASTLKVFSTRFAQTTSS